MAEKFDVTVIGGGPAGYVCAIRLSQLGLKTACVESRGSLGGTCLNIGCIPSKSLLNMSESFHKAKNFSNIGIETGEIKLNLEKMMSNKESSVATLTKGVEVLFLSHHYHSLVFLQYYAFLIRLIEVDLIWVLKA